MTDRITKNDRKELSKFFRFMRKVNEGTPVFHAYGELYGETVFEDRTATPPSGPERTTLSNGDGRSTDSISPSVATRQVGEERVPSR